MSPIHVGATTRTRWGCLDNYVVKLMWLGLSNGYRPFGMLFAFTQHLVEIH